MVPFRELFNEMGLIVNYDAKKRMIRGMQDAGSYNKITLTTGSNQALVNNKPIKVTVAPFVANNTTYIPLRLLGETTEADVKWDAKTNSVTIKEKPDILLERLCKKGDAQGVSKVLAENPNLDVNQDSGKFLLKAILYGENLEVVQRLVSAGANLNVITSVDSTPLMLASNINSEWVQWFLDHGADPKLTNSEGKNALDNLYILDDERKKTAAILSQALGSDVAIDDGKAITIKQLPYEINLEESKMIGTIQSFGESELGYVVRVTYKNTSVEKNYNTPKFPDLKLNGTELNMISDDRISGNETFGKGSAVYDYVFEKPDHAEISLSTFVLTVKEGYEGNTFNIALDGSKIEQQPLTIEQLPPYLNKKYSKVETEKGIAEFSIQVEQWINDSLRVSVNYDSSFFWNKDIMTEIVQSELREHMKQIARDVIERFPDVRFTGGYDYSWYKYPNIRVDLLTSNHMTWDTYGTGEVLEMPISFQWTPSKDDPLNLFEFNH